MTTSAAIQVGHISKFLEMNIEEFIDMTDRQDAKAEQYQRDLKTRALAAFALQHEFPNLTPSELAAYVIDGSDDNGIDAIYVDDSNVTIVMVQSKWHSSGHGGIGVGEILKTLTGLRHITNQKFDLFNSRLFPHIGTLEKALDDANVTFKIILATTGNSDLADPEQEEINHAVDEMDDGVTGMLSVEHLRLRDFHEVVRRGGQSPKVDATFTLESWGTVSEPYAAYYGLANGADLGELYIEHGDRLFDENLRKALGRTPVNSAILETLENNPEHFWYFNNGVTALCETVGKTGKLGASRASGDFRATGVSIVNGAQTVSTLASFLHQNPDGLGHTQVWVRLISLEECPDDFATQVTRGTNTQNTIVNRDFIALDPNQLRIRDEMRLSLQKIYTIKRGEEPPAATDGCTVTEAIVALACAHPDSSLAVLAKRNIGKLEDTGDPNYSKLFPATVSAGSIWDKVVCLREIESTLSEIRKSTDGKQKAIAIQGNRLIAHVVLKEFRKQKASETKPDLPSLTREVHAKMCGFVEGNFASNYITSLFKNTPRCKAIVDGIS